MVKLQDYRKPAFSVDAIELDFDLDPDHLQRVTAATFVQPARRPPRTGFVIDKARRELGYQPHSFAEGIALVAQQSE